jgi:hypothetical protein
VRMTEIVFAEFRIPSSAADFGLLDTWLGRSPQDHQMGLSRYEVVRRRITGQKRVSALGRGR